MRKTEVIDDDGNTLLPPDSDSDVSHVIYLLEYCRKRGFRIGPIVRIGNIGVQIRDLRQEAQLTNDQKDVIPDLAPGSDMALLLGPDE